MCELPKSYFGQTFQHELFITVVNSFSFLLEGPFLNGRMGNPRSIFRHDIELSLRKLQLKSSKIIYILKV